MSNKHTTPNLTADHRAHNQPQAGKRSLLLSFTIFMAWVVVTSVALGLIACSQASAKPIATNTNNGYYIDLSKNVSGLPSRTLLAFFVPVIGVDSQSSIKQTDTAPNAHSSASRGHSLISIANYLLTDYDGLTLQNRIAERRICRAVTNVTESKTRHPILLPYSVALTQKTLGGYHA